MVNGAFLFFNDVFLFFNDVFLFFNDVFFILKLYSLPPFSNRSPIISNHFHPFLIHSFQTLNFLSNSKIFKQTLSIACL
ncbi:hypothetical protein BB456_00595 [Helicobacter pylori]|nr:hypothetical protein BB456_00595 [Helicobacter pylori]